MAFITNSFSVLALIFTVTVPYHALYNHTTRSSQFLLISDGIYHKFIFGSCPNFHGHCAISCQTRRLAAHSLLSPCLNWHILHVARTNWQLANPESQRIRILANSQTRSSQFTFPRCLGRITLYQSKKMKRISYVYSFHFNLMSLNVAQTLPEIANCGLTFYLFCSHNCCLLRDKISSLIRSF